MKWKSVDWKSVRRNLVEATLNVRHWCKREGRWFAVSVGFHGVVLLFLLSLAMPAIPETGTPQFEVGDLDNRLTPEELAQFDLGKAPLEPTELNTETLLQLRPAALPEASAAQPDPAAEIAGGGGTLGKAFGGKGSLFPEATGPGPVAVGGGIGGGGSGDKIGAGGDGTGFGGRGAGMRKALLGGFGGTRETERAVAGGIHWLVKHQNPNGSWSIDRLEAKVARKAEKGKPKIVSGGEGLVRNDTAGTAMALLPFLAANETHRRGGFRKTVGNGLAYLTSVQGADGNLSPGPINQQTMYAHALATIVLCEAYGLTKDRGLRNPTQKAIRFIEGFQHPRRGGWRYLPQDEIGDTSVFGWCVMALKSAQMAGLDVRPQTLELARGWLKKNARGISGGLFPYLGASDAELEERFQRRLAEAKAAGEPADEVFREQNGVSPTRSAIGLLCAQYLGDSPDAPNIREGIAHMMQNLPAAAAPNFYYWYYATQVVHNVPGPDWDQWNRQMRRVLIETQVKSGEHQGSWDPAGDPWGRIGGRLMCTSFGTLILEVYYRYLPLYRIHPDNVLPMKE